MTQRKESEGSKLFQLTDSKAKKDEKKRYKVKKVESDAQGVRIALWDSKHPAFIVIGVVVTAGAAFGAGALAGLVERLLGKEDGFGLGWGLSAAVGGLGAYLTSGHYVVLDFNDMWTSVRRERFNIGYSRRYLTRRVECIHYCEESTKTAVLPQSSAFPKSKTTALVLSVDSDTHLLLKGIDKETAQGILEAVWQRYPDLRPPLPTARLC